MKIFKIKYCTNVAFSLVLLCCASQMSAQNSDTKYRVPIKQSMEKIERIYGVEILDKDQLLDGKSLNYGDWRISKYQLEVSLTALLSPFDLMYWKVSDSVYEIKKFDYPRRTPDIGAQRLEYLKGLYTNSAEWEQRKGVLKSCMVEALWLNKTPELDKPKLILTDKRIYKRQGYSVENIALEVLPGVYTTGSIYKPYPLKKNHAVILSPNGHFGDGRYRESEQIRCANLAKMGAVTVSYDLFGWGESALQFPSNYHRTSIAQTMQVLNGIKLLDYLLGLPFVDPSRVGITGGSGGGSQSLFLTAIDDRIQVSVPVVMVSSYFSGGCPCESGQPIHLCGDGTNNAEIAAMAAPRPQLIISDGGDWTQHVPDLEFPFIQSVYGFYHTKDRVENSHFADEGHDYKISKRMAMYPFMAKYLKLDLQIIQDKKGSIEEKIHLETEQQMKVFGAKGEKLPKDALKEIDKLYSFFGRTHS
ncbi:alpha/beta hydrolase family protein [Galbibacter sp.]|uniref:alpha/beta hydrolase family protein n=1 Tax=Galbibacter sp. TaxID=2918471 RepID=UPI003A909E00